MKFFTIVFLNVFCLFTVLFTRAHTVEVTSGAGWYATTVQQVGTAWTNTVPVGWGTSVFQANSIVDGSQGIPYHYADMNGNEMWTDTLNMDSTFGVGANADSNVYFVKVITLADSNVTSVTGNFLADDTATLYINGTLIEGVMYGSTSWNNINLTQQQIGLLHSGTNYIAMQARNLYPPSWWAYIDMTINGQYATGISNITVNGNDQSNHIFQNVPNPFSGQTSIGYAIHTGTTAYININSLDGKLIKHFDLPVNGNGTVTINGNEISAGTYTYTLMVDGKMVDTKIMAVIAQN
jgi:hypothetical protein